MSSIQHYRYTPDEVCCLWQHVAGVSHRPAICNKSVERCLFVISDKSLCTIARIAKLSHNNRILFEGKDTWCSLSQMIFGILHETDTTNQVVLYSSLIDSWFIDSWDGDCHLFMMSKRTNLDIKDTACLHIVHNFQHPISCPRTKSMQNTMIKAPEKIISSLWLGKLDKSTKRSK